MIVWSCPSTTTLALLALPRRAGVTRARYWLFGANTPGQRVSRSYGLRPPETTILPLYTPVIAPKR
jgi:hypothetical protein